jgi:hypothetical protein
MLVLFSHELKRDPGAQVRKAWAFLKLDDESVSHIKLSPHLVANGPLGARIKNLLQRRGHHSLAASRLFGRFSAALKLVGDRPPTMNRAVRERLLEYYRPLNRALERLLDLDLSIWDR